MDILWIMLSILQIFWWEVSIFKGKSWSGNFFSVFCQTQKITLTYWRFILVLIRRCPENISYWCLRWWLLDITQLSSLSCYRALSRAVTDYRCRLQPLPVFSGNLSQNRSNICCASFFDEIIVFHAAVAYTLDKTYSVRWTWLKTLNWKSWCIGIYFQENFLFISHQIIDVSEK